MLYPFIVPLLLLLGESEIPRPNKPKSNLAQKIYKILFYKKNGKISNRRSYLRNNGTYKYKEGKCVQQITVENATFKSLTDTLDKMPQDGVENINDFLFLCEMYNIEMLQKKDVEMQQKKGTRYVYREINGSFGEENHSLFADAFKIAVHAADGAESVSDKEAAAIAEKIRQCRLSSKRATGSLYYTDLIYSIGAFLDNQKIDWSVFDLIKLSIIDTETLRVWSGTELPHFLDKSRDMVATIAASPEYFFSNCADNEHSEYLHNLPYMVNNLTPAHLSYMEEHLEKYACDKSSDFCRELLKHMYSKLLKTGALKDNIKENLKGAKDYLNTLIASYSLITPNEKKARYDLLLEMLIRLCAAVLTNWNDIDLIPINAPLELISDIYYCLDRIDETKLDRFIQGQEKDEQILTDILFVYEEAGKKISGNSDLIKRFDEKYSEQFLKIISCPIVRARLLASCKQYSNIFSLYRNWLTYKKASIYGNYQNGGISLRSDINYSKVSAEYLERYVKDKSDRFVFEVLDNKMVSRRFRLRLATMDDFKAIVKMNGQDFSRKIFVSSTTDELKFGLDNGAIWMIEDEATNQLATIFIIAQVEGEKSLEMLGEIYGTAALAREAISNKLLGTPFVIFDAVIVGEEYRGLGFQRLGLILAEYLCKNINGKYVCATVSPANTPSFRNFILCDYEKKQTVYYPSRDTVDTPHRRYKEPTEYYLEHKEECDTELISDEIQQFLTDNDISEEDYRQERVAVRTFVVQKID